MWLCLTWRALVCADSECRLRLSCKKRSVVADCDIQLRPCETWRLRGILSPSAYYWLASLIRMHKVCRARVKLNGKKTPHVVYHTDSGWLYRQRAMHHHGLTKYSSGILNHEETIVSSAKLEWSIHSTAFLEMYLARSNNLVGWINIFESSVLLETIDAPKLIDQNADRIHSSNSWTASCWLQLNW